MVENNVDRIWKTFLLKRDEKSKQKLIEYYYIHLVKKIAKGLVKKFQCKLTIDELASHGVDGLYRSLGAYDPSRGIKFETYAYSRIWGSIIDGIREEDWVPRSVRQRQTTIENAKIKLESHLGHKAGDIEAVKSAGFDVKDFQKNHNKFYAASCSSIETSVLGDTDDDESKKDFNKYLIAKDDCLPSNDIVKKEFLSKLMGKNFTPLERKIIDLYYYKGFSMTEISRKLVISESRVSQVHQSILRRLKKKVELNPKYFDDEVYDLAAKN